MQAAGHRRPASAVHLRVPEPLSAKPGTPNERTAKNFPCGLAASAALAAPDLDETLDLEKDELTFGIFNMAPLAVACEEGQFLDEGCSRRWSHETSRRFSRASEPVMADCDISDLVEFGETGCAALEPTLWPVSAGQRTDRILADGQQFRDV